MELHSLGLKVPSLLSQSWKRCSWGSRRAKNKASVHVRAECSSAFSPDSAHWPIVWSPTWPWATWVQGRAPFCHRRAGNLVHQRIKTNRAHFSVSLSRSLNIQVSRACSDHTCSGPWLAPRCDWQPSTFPCRSDLTGHASKLPLSSPFPHQSARNRLGEC